MEALRRNQTIFFQPVELPMCWNATVSFHSFLLGSVGIATAVFLGMPWTTAFFCSTITLMQFIEYIVWTYLGSPSINFYASFVAGLLLKLQPIASILTLPSIYLQQIFLGGYLGIGLLLYFLFPSNTPLKTLYKMTPGPSGHLVWHWLKDTFRTRIHLLAYFFFLFVPLLLSREWTVLGLALLTLGLSVYGYFRDGSWGSMWCWLVNLIVLSVVGKYILFESASS